MRWLLGLVPVALAAPPADACSIIIDPFVVGPVTERIPPGEVQAEVVGIDRVDSPENSSCSDATVIRIRVAASDDTTPAAALGYRLRHVSGVVRFSTTDELHDRKGSVLAVRTGGFDRDLDFELGVSALDASGNVGPETIVPIVDEAPGCNSGGSSVAPGMVLFGLVLWRRRRSCVG